MDMFRLVKLILICTVVFMMYSNAFSEEELPLLMDLAQINLEVINTEIEVQISTTGYQSVTLSSKAGYKLVIVTLTGIITSPCRIASGTSEFTAIYEKVTTNDEGEKKFRVSIKVSDAIAKDDSWAIPPEGARITTTYFIRETGNIIIKVAFVLPEDVDNFFVRYPTLAKGKASILSQSGEKSKK